MRFSISGKDNTSNTGHETGNETGHEKGHEIRHIERLIWEIGDMTLTPSAIMGKLGLKGRGNFLATYLYPAISAGYVAMLYPESEKRKDQAYYLTKKGKDFLDELLRNTADALTFVLNSICNIDSVHYKHFVIFRFDNHFWNFLAFFEDLLILIL